MMSHKTPDTAGMPTGFRRASSWFSRHRGGLTWTGLLIVVVLVQLPLFKGLFYTVSGSPAPHDGIPWRTDFEAALVESRQSGKPVLLDLSASWCPPCQVMKHEVWPNATVREAVVAGYIPVFVDVDASTSVAISRRYGVSSIPSILIVDSEGKIFKQGGFMTGSSLLSFLSKKPA